MLFVSINFSLEKDSVVFSAFVNYNIMLCIEFSSLRLKCDMGEFLRSTKRYTIRIWRGT